MNPATTSVQQQIVDLMLANQKILIMASSPADGDCIGSSLSLYLALKKLDKEVTVVCPDPIPDLYHFLPTTHIIGNRVVASKDFVITINTNKVQTADVKSIVENGKINIIIMPENGRLTEEDVSFNYGPDRYDLIITVDTGGLEQLGQLYAGNIEMFHQIPVINIDHHISNDHFGKVNLVDVMASATTELLIPVIALLEKVSGKPLWDEDIATLLLTGIITDTGSFQNANTTPRAFDASAQLISFGARQQEIIQHIFKTKQLTTLKLWGRILSKMQTDEKFHVVWSALTQKDFADTGAAENETGGIIDELLSNAPGAEIICLLKEKKDGLISGSIRTTNPSIDAAALAETFGGGGHTRAAGFKVTGLSLEKVEQQALKTFREYQSKRLGVPLDGEQEVSVSATPKRSEGAEPVPAPTPKPVIPAPVPQPKLVIPAPKEVPAPSTPAPTPTPPPPAAPQPTPAVAAPTPASQPLTLPIIAHPKPVIPPSPVVPPAAPTPAPAPQAPVSGFNLQQPVDLETTEKEAKEEIPEEVKPQAPYSFEK